MTDFEVMQKMSQDNLDIRMTGTIVRADMVKAGGHITFGVDRNTFNDISHQMFTGEKKYLVAVYVVNKEQFDNIKNTSHENNQSPH